MSERAAPQRGVGGRESRTDDFGLRSGTGGRKGFEAGARVRAAGTGRDRGRVSNSRRQTRRKGQKAPRGTWVQRRNSVTLPLPLLFLPPSFSILLQPSIFNLSPHPLTPHTHFSPVVASVDRPGADTGEGVTVPKSLVGAASTVA